MTTIAQHGGPRPPRARRGPLRRLLETRGTLGGYARDHRRVDLVAEDGVPLAATYLPGPAPDAPAVVLLHGFAAHRRKPAYAYLAQVLADEAHVLVPDLRGHGDSGGRSTLGDREALDAAAACAWLRAHGHGWIGLIGMSMGATTALHLAARGDHDPGAVVVVSATARIELEPTTRPMRRLAAVWRSPWRRAALRAVTGVRVVEPEGWTPPPDPVDAARDLDPPLLVVHGEDDAYFPVRDAEALAAAAGGPSTLWRRPPGFGHAEDGVTPEFARRLAGAVVAAHVDGRFPAWPRA